MKITMQQKLSQLLAEVQAFEQNFKAEIENTPKSGVGQGSCEWHMDAAIYHLSDALFEINEAEAKEAESQPTRAEYKDYVRENEATSGRGQ